MTFQSKINGPTEESFRQYHQLVECSPVAIGALSNDKIVFINSAGAKLFGFKKPEQLVEKSFSDFLHTDYHDLVREHFHLIEEKNSKAVSFEIKLNRADGKIIDLEISAVYFDHMDKPAIQFTLQEISKRIKMEELFFQSKLDWEETFHTITDMITIHDKDFNIIYANKAAVETLKLPSSERGAVHRCFQYYHGTECPPKGCPS
ncbi:MAG: PAS domain S-box protein, partial [Nitrospirota bacterium]